MKLVAGKFYFSMFKISHKSKLLTRNLPNIELGFIFN